MDISDIIVELYSGSLCGNTVDLPPGLGKQCDDAEQALLACLDEAGRKKARAWQNAGDELRGAVSYGSFAQGFRLGARLMLAALADGGP